MLIPQRLVYRPSPTSPYRKGGTWIDVDETTSAEAPVVLEHVCGDFTRQYRLHDGRLWQLQHSGLDAQMSTQAIRLNPDRSEPAFAHRLSTQVMGTNDQPVYWTFADDDDMDDAPGLRESEGHSRLVKIAARGRLLIDGVLHRATPGPLVYRNFSGSLEHLDMGIWSSCSPIVMSRLRPLENGMRGQGIGFLVEDEDLERIDTIDMNVEAAAWVLVLEASRLTPCEVPREAMPLLVALRDELSARHPEPWYDYKVKCIDPIPVDDDGRPWAPMDDHLLDTIESLAAIEIGMNKRTEGIDEIVSRARERNAQRSADALSDLKLI